MNTEAIKDLLMRIADDDLVMGHRNSEWTGLGPILEEDIAFSSMAQDEVGHAQAYYILLQAIQGFGDPDQMAFNRKSSEFRCAQVVEHPIGDYAFSLVRHALYDMAESIRLDALSKGSYRPLSELAKKLAREERYHILHAQTWMRQLGNSTDEANQRLQDALNELYPMAFGLFEPTAYSTELASEGIQPLESVLEAEWVKQVTELAHLSNLSVPVIPDKTIHYGGRKGVHTAHLDGMLKEMDEVFAIDTAAIW